MTDKSKAVTIHKADSSHAAAIARLAQQLAAHEGEKTLCDEQAVARLIQSGQQPDCQFYVALSDEDVIGFVMGYAGYDLSSDSYGVHLSDIIVDKANRFQGIGRALLAQLSDDLLSQGGEWLSLTVLESNQLAQGFYDSLQFETVDVRFVAAGKTILQALR